MFAQHLSLRNGRLCAPVPPLLALAVLPPWHQVLGHGWQGRRGGMGC